MKINFKSITINNFMSIGEAVIELSDRGYTLVSGINNSPEDLARSNGSGKSSIFEAIVWCLTGDTMRGNKDIINCFGNDGALVTIEFNLDNHDYKLIRSNKHSTYKTNLRIEIDGVDKSGKGIRDTEKLLKEYLPDLTPSLIGAVIILGQGLPTRFTNNSPSGRKEVLEKLCKSDFMIEDLKARITARKSALQSILRDSEDNLLTTNTKLNIEQNNLVKQENLLASLSSDTNYDKLIMDLTASIKEKEVQIKQLEKDYSKLNVEIEILTESQSQISNNERLDLIRIDEIYKNDLNDLFAQKNSLSVLITTKNNEVRRLKSITDICPTCKQKLPDVHKPDTTELEQEIVSLQEQLKTAEINYTDALSKYEDQKQLITTQARSHFLLKGEELKQARDKQALIANNINTLNSALNQQQQQITQYTIQRDNLTKNIEECKLNIKEIQDTINALNESLILYNNKKEDVENRSQIINKFNTIITRDFRGYLLQSVIEFIDTKAKEYAQDIFETDLIEFRLDGNNISISYNNKQYEALSGGERQKVDLIIQFSIRDMLCKYTNFSTNLLALDEIFDNLDDLGSQKIIDLISKKLSDISSVFIISHHGNELNIPSDNEIIVIKDVNGVSSVK